MSGNRFMIVPQRYKNGWKDCEEHQATSFAVISQRKLRGKQHRFVQSRHTNKKAAQADLKSRQVAAAGSMGDYRLGKRMKQKPVHD